MEGLEEPFSAAVSGKQPACPVLRRERRAPARQHTRRPPAPQKPGRAGPNIPRLDTCAPFPQPRARAMPPGAALAASNDAFLQPGDSLLWLCIPFVTPYHNRRNSRIAELATHRFPPSRRGGPAPPGPAFPARSPLRRRTRAWLLGCARPASAEVLSCTPAGSCRRAPCSQARPHIPAARPAEKSGPGNSRPPKIRRPAPRELL